MTKTARRLETAIHEVRERRLGLRAASRYYHVPYSTLRDNSKSSPSTPRAPRGRPPCLTQEEELLIESAILEFADHAFPLRKSDIQDLIQLFAFRLPINRRHRCLSNTAVQAMHSSPRSCGVIQSYKCAAVRHLRCSASWPCVLVHFPCTTPAW